MYGQVVMVGRSTAVRIRGPVRRITGQILRLNGQTEGHILT